MLFFLIFFKNNIALLDDCDRFKWRQCTNDEDCAWEKWKRKAYTDGSTPAMWESEASYSNYHEYTCVVPTVSGCHVKRCVPNISRAGGHYCSESGDCFDGQICSSENTCIQCADENFAKGACHQVQTFGAGGTPPFAAGESGCAGDHCLHVCAYDTMCVRVLDTDTELTLTATHNQLPGTLQITNDVREELIRPSECDGSDQGSATGGMRCAGEIYRMVTSRQRTPDAIRDRLLNTVELSILKYDWENWVSFDSVELNTRSVFREDGGHNRGVLIGYEIPHFVLSQPDAEGMTLGYGSQGFGLSNWHWGKTGRVQCDVKYSTTKRLHKDWFGMNVDASITRSTLLTRVCIRWDGVSDDWKWCADWGTKSNFHQTLPFSAICTLNGPNVRGVIPTAEQREVMKSNLMNAFNSGLLSTSELLRASFHDASTYTDNPSDVKGGPQGCMIWEHIHGSIANQGLAFFIDKLPEGSGCNNWECPWSVADILQFAGSVAVEHAEGPDFSESLKWGRTDAPYIFCMGELQLSMPDANGGHNVGAFQVGSSDIASRLSIVLESTITYFEDQLGLSTREWIALLGGGHTLGGVRGFITARNTRFSFDNTVDTFDNLYFQRLSMAKDSTLMSLCPQMKAMGHSHFWEPGDQWQTSDHWQVLIDTDVSLTTEELTMNVVREYAEDVGAFFSEFVNAFLKVSELGYGTENLHVVPGKAVTKRKTS